MRLPIKWSTVFKGAGLYIFSYLLGRLFSDWTPDTVAILSGLVYIWYHLEEAIMSRFDYLEEKLRQKGLI